MLACNVQTYVNTTRTTNSTGQGYRYVRFFPVSFPVSHIRVFSKMYNVHDSYNSNFFFVLHTTTKQNTRTYRIKISIRKKQSKKKPDTSSSNTQVTSSFRFTVKRQIHPKQDTRLVQFTCKETFKILTTYYWLTMNVQ